VGLFTVNPLVRRTVGTNSIFNILDKPIGNPPLFFSGVPADFTGEAALGHLFLQQQLTSYTPLNKNVV
jgi:hypothetical protein